MSKFTNHFNRIEVTDELSDKTLMRIEESKRQEKVTSRHYQSPKQKRIRFRIVALASVFTLILLFPLLSVLALGIENTVSNPAYDFSRARQVRSVGQLNSLLSVREHTPRRPFGLLNGCSSIGSPNGGLFGGENRDTAVNDSAPPESSSGGGRPGSGGGTSEINVQVAGMDEGDIVRNDGQFIYRLAPNGLTIVKTDNGQISYVTSVAYRNFAPIEMYVRGNRMIIIGGTFDTAPNHWDMDRGGFMSFRSFHRRVQIRVYDISNISQPNLERFFEIDGNFHTSRIRIETETLFFVVQYFTRTWNPDVRQTEARRPYYRTSETADFSPLPLDNIFYFRNNPTSSYMILGSIDLNDLDAKPHVKAYLSSSGIISVSPYNLYISTAQRFFNWRGGERTRRSYIARFSLEDLSHTGYVTVLGTPVDRHAIDEYNGYLRIATTYGNIWNLDTLASAVFVFNSDLKEVSRITGIAPRETMDSAAFSGNFGFISTSPPWLIWDPLYTVDLTDPYNPTISEGLETDGINDYLRPIPGTPFVIGIGQDAPPGGSAMQTGIKIELYDMKPGTDEMPESLAKYSIFGAWTFAEVLRNPRALLFMFDEDSKRVLVGFAAESADWVQVGDGINSRRGHFIFSQGFFLFEIDALNGTMEFLGTEQIMRIDGQDTTILLPTLSNFDTSSPIFPILDNNHNWNSGWQAQVNLSQKYISRAVINQGFIYTVSDTVIAGYCLCTFTRIDTFTGLLGS